MACLEMLARHHKVPFRRDVIERAAKDNLRGKTRHQPGADRQPVYVDGLYRNVGRLA